MYIRNLLGLIADKRAYSTHTSHRNRCRGMRKFRKTDEGASWTREGRGKQHYEVRRLSTIVRTYTDPEEGDEPILRALASASRRSDFWLRIAEYRVVYFDEFC